MPEPGDTNASIWKSDEVVERWVAGAPDRERTRQAHWRLMGELLPFSPGDRFTFVDLGAGIGAAARAILELYPNSQAVLADYSSQMIEQGQQALADYAGRFHYVVYDMLHDDWPAALPERVDAVVSSLCVHHLPDPRKEALFGAILGHLEPAGWYLNYDPVSPPDAIVEAAWERANDRQDPILAEKHRHRSAPEQAQYENHVRHMIPLDRQVSFLKAAGFEAVDVYWKHLDYVIYGGRRPLTTP